MTDLHALLGDRYDDVIERDTHTLPCGICHPSPVELARRAMAWDEGYIASAIDANSGSATPNPYRSGDPR